MLQLLQEEGMDGHVTDSAKALLWLYKSNACLLNGADMQSWPEHLAGWPGMNCLYVQS